MYTLYVMMIAHKHDDEEEKEAEGEEAGDEDALDALDMGFGEDEQE